MNHDRWNPSASWNACSEEGVHSNDFIVDWVFLSPRVIFLKEEGAISPSFGRRLLDYDIYTCSYYFDTPASRIDFVIPRPLAPLPVFTRSFTGDVILVPRSCNHMSPVAVIFLTCLLLLLYANLLLVPFPFLLLSDIFSVWLLDF